MTKFGAAVFLALAPSIVVAGQVHDLPNVLGDAGQYVRSYQEQLIGMTAEESYVQTATTSGRTVQRTQKSDVLLLVRIEGADLWVQFRDVFEVDGKAVRNRDDRLAKLFLNPTRTLREQLRAITDESTRYNLGVERTINNPVLPLLFLDPTNQARFMFTLAPASRPAAAGEPLRVPRDMPAAPAFEVPANAIEIRYQETQKRTIVRTEGDRDLAASGRFWIEPSSGRILASNVVFDDGPVLRARISVAYQPGPVGTLLVPREMREDYTSSTTTNASATIVMRRVVVSGVATYSNFRRFQVHTDEQLVR
jgi:hypothetical protein